MTGLDRLHEIAEDVGRTVWLRDLGAALSETADAIEREARDLSGYESDVLAWVEKNGGLDAVKEQRRESIPRAAYERKKAGWLDHIEECEEALARRNGRIAELRLERDKLRDEAAWAESLSEILDEWADLLGFPEQKGDPGKITARVGAVLDGTWRRLMPEGCEWPRYESGDLVMFGDCVENRNGTCTVNSVRFYSGGGVTVYGEDRGSRLVVVTEPVMHEPIRKARPKVLAADGEPLEVGQTVWEVDGTGHAFEVVGIRPDTGRAMEPTVVTCDVGDGTSEHFLPSQLTHQRPVLDADGVPIKKGEHVFGPNGGQYRVTSAHDGKVFARHVYGPSGAEVESAGGEGLYRLRADRLTHTKPEPDSWSSVWADVSNGNETPEGMMRRCQALAERGE